jgi:hypothetical protein
MLVYQRVILGREYSHAIAPRLHLLTSKVILNSHVSYPPFDIAMETPMGGLMIYRFLPIKNHDCPKQIWLVVEPTPLKI